MLKKIWIEGGSFTGKGSEAMLSVIMQTLNERFSNIQFYSQYYGQEDKKKKEDLNIQCVSWVPQSKLRHIINLICSILKIKQKHNIHDLNKLSADDRYFISNYVIDVSGFVLSSQFKFSNSINCWWRSSLAKRSGNCLIMMPQSCGPFNGTFFRFFAKLYFRNCDIFFSREETSSYHIKSLGRYYKNKALTAPDIAFNFKPDSVKNAQDILKNLGLPLNENFITITPNMQIYRRTDGDQNGNSYVRSLLEIVELFLGLGVNIVLIAHEMSYKRQNDYELCQMIKDQFSLDEKIFIVDAHNSAAVIKRIIGMSEFLVSSRYHSLVAALSMRVSVFTIGWSHKYTDLLKSVGLSKFVTDYNDEKLLEKIQNAWQNKDSIRRTIEYNIPTIEDASKISLSIMLDSIAAHEKD